ncbi:hypothetical protein DYB36_002273 [Aphanomyces astaci]|uniref:Uncharacterized protein n=1 Tax=Aphanomyces astaci TaxID=112090 RepID=A0A397AGG5_APHAT|nr:hypothetical protein DYB36_002273 [Aphanomyces astaci]
MDRIPLPLPPSAADASATWLTEDEYNMFSIHKQTKSSAASTKKRKAMEGADTAHSVAVKHTETEPASLSSCWDDVLHAKKSLIPVEDHAVYLELKQRKITAQKIGMPAILALSDAERDTIDRIDAVVVNERRDFQKHFERLAKRELVVLTTLPEAVDKKAYDVAAPKHTAKALVIPGSPKPLHALPATPSSTTSIPDDVVRATLSSPWLPSPVVSLDPAVAPLMHAHKCKVAFKIPVTVTDQRQAQPVTMHAKMDYQWSLQPEQVTERDRAHIWLHSWMRGNARIVFGMYGILCDMVDVHAPKATEWLS